MAGGAAIGETKRKKAATIEVFQDVTFTVHKWHSNASELEEENDADAGELTHTKRQLGGTKPSGSKLLGLPWDQEQDIFHVVSNVEEGSGMTKRSILSQLAKVYDPLGLASPNIHTYIALFVDAGWQIGSQWLMWTCLYNYNILHTYIHTYID